MNKRIFALLLAALMLLSGCQLAQPDAREEKQRDRMVGVFITTDYLDLFDMEAYLKDHSNLLSGGTIAPEDDFTYANRIYAKHIEQISETGTFVRYIFEDLEGIVAAAYLVKPNGGVLESYWMSDVTEGICDVSLTHNSRDDGEDHSITGTIYLSPEFPDPCFYFNPIYQTEEGDVYLVAGQGMAFDSDPGINATHTLNESTTYTVNGETRSYTAESKITMKSIEPAEKIVVLFMDEESQEISRNEYAAEVLPEEITPAAGTAYLLVEEHTAQSLRRTLYQQDDRYVSVFLALENYICINQQISILWPK